MNDTNTNFDKTNNTKLLITFFKHSFKHSKNKENTSLPPPPPPPIYKRRKLIFTFSIALLIISSFGKVSAQKVEKQITGTVTNEKDEVVPGVNVILKGSNQGTITDFNGKYILNVADSENTTLIFSMMGFITQEVSIDNRTLINVTLKENVSNLENVVVVGYGEQSKAKVINSIASIKGTEITGTAITSFDEGLAGQLTGIQIIQESGAPGSNAKIDIRGIGTLTAGTSPLIVVDDFPFEKLDLNSIDPNSIESIDILKDAAATAIYGSRGANGVIIVTTKKGKSDFKVSYNGYIGFQQVTKTINMQNAYEFAKFVSTARENRGRTTPDLYKPYINGDKGLTNTNWQNEIFRTAPINSHGITLSGTTNKINFFVSTNYLTQKGIVLGSYYDRLNFRANLNLNVSEKLKAGFNLAPSYSHRNKVSEGDHKNNGVFLTALMANPVFKPYNDDGSLNTSGDMILSARNNGQATVENPVALALRNKDERKRFNMLGGGFLELKPFESLTLKSYMGFNMDFGTREYLSPKTVGAYKILSKDKQAKALNSFHQTINNIFQNTLNYKEIFGNINNVNLLVGQSFQTESLEYTSKNPLQSETRVINEISTTSYPLYKEKWALISYFSRLNYDFKDKYILGVSIRTDGSSRFGKNNKWGWFPSVSGAWRLSQESFFKIDVVSEFKIRGSWGITGNNNISNYGAISLLEPSNYGDNNGLSPSTSPNENLSWEKTNTFDIGIDISFFDNKMSITADYYRAVTNDLLLEVPVPSHSGNTSSLRNIGKVLNQGFEFCC